MTPPQIGALNNVASAMPFQNGADTAIRGM